ncbi:hypothetical protein GGS20DRAFT_586317 [Poronia punctata]|nr:hypothetical protein GGS20DRAFT_586317 [Poronia punctata]
MAEVPVLRFPVSGQEDGWFLLEVSSNGARPLDLKLVGSESTAVFLVKLRHKKINEYKASPAHCTDEEWEQTLTSIFVDLQPLPDIEVRADVQGDGSAVTLSFRKNIQGITQRLGSIKLEENDKTEISPFDWCVSAIASRTKVAEELAAATSKVEELEESINKLKAQLEDFIKTKDEDETQMLEKFCDVLNEKKAKIRQQLRLLAAAKVDPQKLASIAGEEALHRDAGPSRSGKRKTPAKDGEESSDDGFEKMDVDKTTDDAGQAATDMDSDVDTEDLQQSTDDDVTASEADTAGSSEDQPPITAKSKKKKGKAVTSQPKTKPAASRGKQPAGPSRNTRASTQNRAPEKGESEDEPPPPPRNLPFLRGKKATQTTKPADDDETASDEDSEL